MSLLQIEDKFNHPYKPTYTHKCIPFSVIPLASESNLYENWTKRKRIECNNNLCGDRYIDLSGLDNTKTRIKANKQATLETNTSESSSFHVSTKQGWSWWSFGSIFIQFYLYDFNLYIFHFHLFKWCIILKWKALYVYCIPMCLWISQAVWSK